MEKKSQSQLKMLNNVKNRKYKFALIISILIAIFGFYGMVKNHADIISTSITTLSIVYGIYAGGNIATKFTPNQSKSNLDSDNLLD